MIRSIYRLLCVVLLARAALAAPAEVEQVLFLIDDSSSMTSRAGDPTHPLSSRWDLLQLAYPVWSGRLAPGVRVGALSVGGFCGSPPQIRLRVGTERAAVAAAISAARPNGATNLNASLRLAPSLFDPSVQGARRIVLLSDGLNTCAPEVSTCDLLRELHRDHGIVVDVVAWVTDRGMWDEARCWAAATGGTFTPAATLSDLANIPLPDIDPWRYVLLAAAFSSLVLAMRVLYRHAHHALGWPVQRAFAAAVLLLAGGSLAVWSVLFARAGLAAAVVGALALFVMSALANRLSARACAGAFALALSVAAGPAFPEPASPVPVRARADAALYHHVFVVDISRSIFRRLAEMAAFLRRYFELAVAPGEQITLIVFGSDKDGLVREVGTFTAEAGQGSFHLDRLLHDLDAPKETMTYFRPLADFLNAFLQQRVRLSPVIFVLSDGKSDSPKGAKAPRHDIPFESFGTRGVFSAAGAHDWKVAVQGGTGLKLQALFRQAIPLAPEPAGPALAVDPRLLEPDMIVSCAEPLRLVPSWNPLVTRRHGDLRLKVSNEPVPRYRTFTVELHAGGQKLVVGRVDGWLVGNAPQSLGFPVDADLPEGLGQAEVRVVLVQPDGSTKTVYLDGPATVPLEQVSYWNEHGAGIVAGATPALAMLVFALMAWYFRLKRERSRPECVGTAEGGSVTLPLGMRQSLGGDGCALELAGVTPGLRLAMMEWLGVRGQIQLAPETGVKMKIDGVEHGGPALYRIGRQTLELTEPSGARHEVMLCTGDLSHTDLAGGLAMPATAPAGFDDLELGGGPTAPATGLDF